MIIVEWDSRAVWPAFPGDRVAALNRQFDDQVGADKYQLLEIGDDDDVLA